MAATESYDVRTLELFYERYVIACGELGAEPFPPEELLALMDVLVERTTATVN